MLNELLADGWASGEGVGGCDLVKLTIKDPSQELFREGLVLGASLITVLRGAGGGNWGGGEADEVAVMGRREGGAAEASSAPWPRRLFEHVV